MARRGSAGTCLMASAKGGYPKLIREPFSSHGLANRTGADQGDKIQRTDFTGQIAQSLGDLRRNLQNCRHPDEANGKAEDHRRADSGSDDARLDSR